MHYSIISLGLSTFVGYHSHPFKPGILDGMSDWDQIEIQNSNQNEKKKNSHNYCRG